MPTWQTRGLLFVFCSLTLITMLTNKYVLSTLKFTYPTIYQSWQTGTVAVVLLILHGIGYIQLDLTVNRNIMIAWFPATVYFTGMIYSGSVALSKLPIPVFCVLHYMTFMWVSLIETILHKKALQVLPTLCLALVGLSSVIIARSDPQFNRIGYTWMILHCIFAGMYLYTENSLKSLKLREINKIFYNTISSIIILMAVCVGTGELYKVLEFPFLYTRTFHIGCLVSGLFGAVLSIQGTVIANTEYKLSLPTISCINKILLSSLSLLVFQAGYTISMALSIMVGLLVGLIYCNTLSNEDPVVDPQHLHVTVD
ncbi:transmembrane protein 241-like [Actinia tenebrosa]|uniref:Transmembrane protein 241-like n=1 Tax=Actinia tenebrosa TaxID=6105 RepID=A0A6P8I222_ACTTE|nr:transmembrane protein 241-like [Actinia tenebrosa]